MKHVRDIWTRDPQRVEIKVSRERQETRDRREERRERTGGGALPMESG